ncbi:MAG: DsbA family oxidoreductase [Stappiaceae bacterium]
MSGSDTIQIDIVSDVMCPWCYIGKRRMEKALELAPDVSVNIQWRPFQLDGTLPAEGKDRQQYLTEKFGGKDQARTIYARIEEAGKLEGIPFEFDRITKSPNTLDCHRLLRWAAQEGVQGALAEELFRLYFVEGADLTEADTLVQAAEKVGMAAEDARERLKGQADADETKGEIQAAHQMGITGVPCFIVDNKYALMGAETAENIAGVLKKAALEKGTSD